MFEQWQEGLFNHAYLHIHNYSRKIHDDGLRWEHLYHKTGEFTRMNVFQLLTPKRETMYLNETSTLASAMDQLRISGYTAVPVIHEDGTYAGTISEGDFLWAFIDGKDEDAKGHSLPLKSILQPGRNPAVKINVDLTKIFEEALNQNFIPVVDDRNMFIGIITRKMVISFFLSTCSHLPREHAIQQV